MKSMLQSSACYFSCGNMWNGGRYVCRIDRVSHFSNLEVAGMPGDIYWEGRGNKQILQLSNICKPILSRLAHTQDDFKILKIKSWICLLMNSRGG